VARETLDDLAGELAALLSRLDTAVRARLDASRPREIGTRPELPHVVATALRWLTHPSAPPTARQARSTHAKSRAADPDAF
jgi:hypothetical protein